MGLGHQKGRFQNQILGPYSSTEGIRLPITTLEISEPSYLEKPHLSLPKPSLHVNGMHQLRPAIYAPRRQLHQCPKNFGSGKGLTHVDGEGKAHMVDVSDKAATLRTATAEGTVYVGPEVAALIKDNSLKKGDVLTVSQLAGIIGAKKTSELIPLCHNINLNNVKISSTLNLESHTVRITCTAKCHGKTGVEMEALTGVSVAALAVYDMCKAVTHDMVIKEIRLVEKTGGRRDVYLLDENQS